MNRLTALAVLCAAGVMLGGGALIHWWISGSATRQPLEMEGAGLDGVYNLTGDAWRELYERRLSAATGWVHLPKPPRKLEFRSGVDPFLLGFVPLQICGECHPDKLQSVLQTAHARTSSAATPQTVLGDCSAGGNVLATRDPNLHFEMLAQDQSLFQRVVIHKDGRPYVHTERFDLVTGSGNHGQSYLYWRGDELYQLPVSYFTESGGWINSPGMYRDGTADFAREIGERCLGCHATYFASAPGTRNRYDRTNYLLGVTCVRCHGAGWAHVQYHRTHPEESAQFIVHPGKLPRDRANEICAQCHSGLGRLLQPAFAYRPGEPLVDFIELDFSEKNTQNDDPHAANQLARLIKSRCFQESKTLTCATCHDPHQQERGKLQLFAERCTGCHAVDDCRFLAQGNHAVRDRCIECHMPARRDIEGTMQTRVGAIAPLLRDHLVKVWPDATQRVIDQTTKRPPTVDVPVN